MLFGTEQFNNLDSEYPQSLFSIIMNILCNVSLPVFILCAIFYIFSIFISYSVTKKYVESSKKYLLIESFKNIRIQTVYLSIMFVVTFVSHITKLLLNL